MRRSIRALAAALAGIVLAGSGAGFAQADYYPGARGWQRAPRHAPPPRARHYPGPPVRRPYVRHYPGYGYHYRDDDAYKWLSFTAITLGLLGYLDAQQQRAHEAAQVHATTAPLGEVIVWREGGASGSVTAIREGTTSSGGYCREFRQEVQVAGRVEQAYGTACQQPDGSWQIVSTR